MENYDMEENTLEGEGIVMSESQKNNANFLMKLRSLESNNIQIFPASIAIELYKKFRKRDVNLVALFKGTFEIACSHPPDAASAIS